MIDTTELSALRLTVFALALALLATSSAGCAASHHPTTEATLGQSSSSSRMLAALAEPGPTTVRTVVSADWEVPLSGLLNLDHERAVAAGLEDRTEPIHVFMHVVEHPEFGTYLIDSGIAESFRDPATDPHLGFIVAKAMNTDALVVRKTTAEWMREAGTTPAGVFLTHIHLDHILGLPDLPKDTPVYTGPAETGAHKATNLVSAGTTDRLLAGLGALREWQFRPDPDGMFDGVVDVFGDGSLWALHVPGHSPGSTAFVARTADGPVLMVGDASHTAWGWTHGVEPGTFSDDGPRSAASLARLRELAARFESMDVRLGHQHLES